MFKLAEDSPENKFFLERLIALDKIHSAPEFVKCLEKFGYGEGLLEALRYTPDELTAVIRYTRPGGLMNLKLQEKFYGFNYTIEINHEVPTFYRITASGLGTHACLDFIKIFHGKKFTEVKS